MKVEIEIPKGKYCNDCKFCGISNHEDQICYYQLPLVAILKADWDTKIAKNEGLILKDPNCPNLKVVRK